MPPERFVGNAERESEDISIRQNRARGRDRPELPREAAAGIERAKGQRGDGMGYDRCHSGPAVKVSLGEPESIEGVLSAAFRASRSGPSFHGVLAVWTDWIFAPRPPPCLSLAAPPRQEQY